MTIDTIPIPAICALKNYSRLTSGLQSFWRPPSE